MYKRSAGLNPLEQIIEEHLITQNEVHDDFCDTSESNDDVLAGLLTLLLHKYTQNDLSGSSCDNEINKIMII